ncbi:MAG: hypothetical protein QNJ20_13350 [Paracoccaceae bacterium]|nr:hypothetical protein [Paracoccaceae bacterium]
MLVFDACRQDAKIAVSPLDLFGRQLTLFETHSLNHNIPDALHTLSAIGDDVRKVISHQVSLEEIADVMAGNQLPGSMKVQMAV